MVCLETDDDKAMAPGFFFFFRFKPLPAVVV